MHTRSRASLDCMVRGAPLPRQPPRGFASVWVRTSHGPLAILLVGLVLGCSSTPAADHPKPSSSGDAEVAPADTTPTKWEDSSPEASPGPKKKKSSSGSIPDDYELTNRDCDDLGKQFANVIRSDEAAKLSPKLKDKQREAAMGSIDKAAVQRQDQWIEGCQKNLVGKTVDHQSLKCAMDAKSVKEFDACLNGPPPEKTETK